LEICGSDSFAGEEVFEFFWNNHDWQLRQIGRQKNLRIFLGYLRLAAEEFLQAKECLNVSGTMMICGYDNLQPKKSLNNSGIMMTCS